MGDVTQWLAGAAVDPAVLALRPDYRVLLLVAEDLEPGPSDEASEAVLRDAERRARELIDGRPPEEVEQVRQWREAYRSFGAKPQRTRPSLEALLRRLDPGLPRVDRVTDVYNAVSVAHLLPLGGEDLDRYDGPARLVRATGREPFDAVAGGEPVVEHPDAGEVVWRDDAGVTCRRWNWRQGTRTRITLSTRRAAFILDGLEAAGTTGVAGLPTAADELSRHLSAFSPHARFARRELP